MRKTLTQTLLAAFCAILLATPLEGGGVMLIGMRNAILAGGAAPGPTPAYWGLCFTAEAANSSVQLTAVGSPPAVTLVKSFDGINWEAYAVGEVIDLPSTGDLVYLAAGEGGNESFGSSASAYHKFVINGLVAASGDITSLRRFDLEQTTLATNCYTFMFSGCTGLTSAPELPATTLASRCYASMFKGCTGLTSAPELPATTLANSCYFSMFNGCTGLMSAPELPATTLASYCYYYMFGNCAKLSLIRVHFTAWGAQTSDWVSNVSPTGTFYKPTALTEEYGTSKIPTGWTVVNID